MSHALHKIVGECIDRNDFPDCRIIKDPLCGGNHNIPLFCSKGKSNATEYCNVDLLILQDNKIRVIIEIEEANIKPTQICGKFLISALSSYFIHESEDNRAIEMGDLVSFIQILDTANLQDRTSKVKQWKNLENSIMELLSVEEIKIGKYKLLYGNVSDFKDGNSNKCAELITYIKEVLE